MKKRLWSILLVVAMCVTMLPVTALAVDISDPPITELTIGSTKLEPSVYYLIDEYGNLTKNGSEQNYNVYYDKDQSILTLKDATLKSAIYVPGGTKIQLIGTNILGSQDKVVSVGIQTISESDSNQALIITSDTEDASLTIWSRNEGIVDGTDSDKYIIIQNGTIHITNTQSAPIYSRNGGITIKGNANVTATSGNSAISCRKNLIIRDNAEVTVNGNAVHALTSSNKIVISGNSVVNATSSDSAISGYKGIGILDNANVTATGSTALNSFAGSINIGGTVEATTNGKVEGTGAVSVGQGDTSTGSVTVTGKLTASGYWGILNSGMGDIIIDGGDVVVNNATAGMAPRFGGDISIKNHANVNLNVNGYGFYYGEDIGQITIENSTVSVASNYCAFQGSFPTLTYTNDYYTVHAGDSVDSASVVAHSNLTDEIYQSKYVKIQPAEPYTVTVEGGSAEPATVIEGESVIITAEVPSGKKFVNWTTEDGVTFADANAQTTTFTMPAKDVTVTANFRSSGGTVVTPTYPPTITEPDNGDVTVSPTSPKQGDTVTVTPKPDEGYQVDKVTVTDSNGKEITVKDNGDGTYSFTQPSGKATITVTFKATGCPKDETCPISKFTDSTPTAWYHDGVHYVLDEGLMVGISETEFAPNATLTRAELAQILYNKAGKPEVSGLSTFSDVPATAWYAKAVAWAQQNNVVSGVGGNQFAPNQTITRESIAVMLYNDAEKPTVTGTLDYKDAASVSEWAKDAVLWATQNKVINGAVQSDGTLLLNPTSGATRAETAAMLTNYDGK